MTQFPTNPGFAVQDARPRTGILAGFSLISGILSLLCCCLPLAGVLLGPSGVLGGLLVLRKGPEAEGRGVAVGGIVTGALGTIAGIVVLGGVLIAMMSFRNMANEVGQAITDAQGGNPAAIKALVAPPAGPLTDEQADVFAKAVDAKLGKFQKPMTGLMDIIPATMRFVSIDQARAQRLSGSYQPLVYPGQFDNGRGAIVLLLPKVGGATTPSGTPVFANIGVYQEGSTDVIWLAEPAP